MKSVAKKIEIKAGTIMVLDEINDLVQDMAKAIVRNTNTKDANLRAIEGERVKDALELIVWKAKAEIDRLYR